MGVHSGLAIFLKSAIYHLEKGISTLRSPFILSVYFSDAHDFGQFTKKN